MMNTDEHSSNLLGDLFNAFVGPNMPDTARYATYAGAALAGGALYYYLNNQTKPLNLIDYKMQTREIQVTTATKKTWKY
jgi:hypothetical protein